MRPDSSRDWCSPWSLKGSFTALSAQGSGRHAHAARRGPDIRGPVSLASVSWMRGSPLNKQAFRAALSRRAARVSPDVSGPVRGPPLRCADVQARPRAWDGPVGLLDEEAARKPRSGLAATLLPARRKARGVMPHSGRGLTGGRGGAPGPCQLPEDHRRFTQVLGPEAPRPQWGLAEQKAGP